MHRKFNPPTIRSPGTYTHGVESAPGLRWLHVAGQVGVEKDGTLAPDCATQAATAFDNLFEVLKGANMGIEDIVKITTFMVDRNDLPAMREARAKAFGNVRAASTLLIVAGLAQPELKIEVECIAAKA